MNNIQNFIIEKLRLNKNISTNCVDDLFNGIDIHDWKYPNGGISDDELQKCKDNVKNFAYELYPNDKRNALENIFKSTYKEYLSLQNISEETAKEGYDEMIDKIKRLGFTQVECYNMPQGWWHFVDWLIKKQK